MTTLKQGWKSCFSALDPNICINNGAVYDSEKYQKMAYPGLIRQSQHAMSKKVSKKRTLSK